MSAYIQDLGPWESVLFRNLEHGAQKLGQVGILQFGEVKRAAFQLVDQLGYREYFFAGIEGMFSEQL